MSFERHEIRHQVGIGTKLVLIGGILFVIALAAHGSQPSLGFEEQSLLSLVIMVSVPIWVIGGGMPWSSCRQLASIERSGQNALDSKCLSR